MLQEEALGKLTATSVIVDIVEARLVRLGNIPAPLPQDSYDVFERARGQYFQARTEFEQRQWSLSLAHTRAAIASLTTLYETLATLPLE